MSETLNAGSEEELPVDETSGADDAASQETTDESTNDVEPKGKEKALRDTEAALAASKAEYTQVRQQIAEMKGALTTLTQLQTQRAQPVVEEKDWMDEMDDEKVLSDPKASMKLMRDRMRSEFAQVLEARDAYLASKFGAASIDPELKSKVDELKNDPDFSDLPEAKLIAMAKKFSPAKKAVMQPRGSITGSQRTASTAPKKDELSEEAKAYLIMTGAIPSKKRDNTLE